MADSMELKLKLSLDSKQYTAALQLAGQQVQQFSGQLEGELARASVGADRLADAIAKAGHYGAGLFALNKVGELAKGFIQTADAVTTLNNTLRLATGSAQAAGQAYTALFDIAQRSRVSFTELGATFASLNRAGQEMGVSQQRMLSVTEAVSNAMTISGGSAQSLQAALVQLGQGMASGVLRGEELNSVMEQAPRLAKALADGMGVPLGKLRELGSEGKITAEQVVRALESQAAVLRGEVSGATMTASQAFTQLSNATTVAVGELDKATGASAAVAQAISSTAQAITAAGKAFKDNEGAITTTLGVLGGAATAAGVVRVAGAITGAGGTVAAIGAVRTAMLALSATLAANPVGLVLLGIGAATGAAIAMNRGPSTMEGLAREIEYTSDRIAKAQRQLDAAGGAGQGALTSSLEGRLAGLRKYRDELQQSWATQSAAQIDTRAEDERNARATAQLKEQKKAEEELDRFRQKTTGLPESYFANMQEAIRLNQLGLLVGKEWDDFLKRQQKDAQKHLEPQEKKASGGISVSDSALAGLQAQLLAARQYREQLVTLGASASELNAGERESLKIGDQLKRTTDAKTIARLQEKQAIADALGVQLRSNDGLEKSLKANQALIDGNYKDAESITQRARAQEAANDVFGKGRTAIEQMALATMENKLAEATQRDDHDPSFIASLRAKIAAQKDWVVALQAGDYKAAEKHVDELLRGAQELARAYEDEQQLSGLTALEREKITAQRAVELKYAKELAAIDNLALSDTEKERLREEALRAKRIESAAAVAKAEQQYMARASDEINRSLTDALMRGFEDGKGMAENLADATVNLFKTMILRPTISAIMTPVSLVINGVIQQGLNAVGLGSGGSNSAMSTLGNAGGILSGASAMGGAVAAGAGWLTGATTFGGALSAGGSLVAAGGAGVLPGMGMIAGALAPIGVGLAGLYSLYKSLDKSGTPHLGAAAEYSGGVLQGGEAVWKRQGTSGRYSAAAQASADAIAKGVGDTLDGVAHAFGKKGGYAVMTGYSDDSSDDPGFGSFRVTQDGKKVKDWEDGRTSKWAPKIFADGEEGWKMYLTAIAKDTRQVLLDMDLPSWARTMLSQIDDAAGMDGLSNVLAQITQAQTLFQGLADTLVGFAGIADTTQEALLKAAGGADALAQSTSGYYQNFYGEEERQSIAKRQLGSQLSGLGLDGFDFDAADARATYRSAVEAALAQADAATGEAKAKAAETAAALLGLSAAVSQVTASASASTAQMQREQQERSTLEKMLGEQHVLWADLAQAQGDSATAAQRRYWIETAGMTAAEQAAYDFNAALRAQVSAAQRASSALADLGSARFDLENQLLGLRGDDAEVARRTRERDLARLTEGLSEAERDRIAAAYDANIALRQQIAIQEAANAAAQDAARAQEQAAQSAANAAQQLTSAWQAATDAIYGEVARIRGLTAGNAAGTLAAAQTSFALATVQARAGDQEAAKALPELSRALLTIAESTATSATELRRIQGQTAASLEGTGGALVEKYGLKVPAYDIGTNYVTRDHLALVHEGEAIVPKAFNPAAFPSGLGDGQALRLLGQILSVLEDVQAETRASAVSSASVAKALARVMTPARDALRTQEKVIA